MYSAWDMPTKFKKIGTYTTIGHDEMGMLEDNW